MWLVVGFAALGFLIGNLVGLTAHSVVTSVLTLIFAFAGGSVVAFLGKLEADDRRVAGQMLFSLSLFCVLGTYSGISISEWHLLSPRPAATASPSASKEAPHSAAAGEEANCEIPAINNKYLNDLLVSEVNDIDWRYRNGDLRGKPADAYQLLYALLQEPSKKADEAGK